MGIKYILLLCLIIGCTLADNSTPEVTSDNNGLPQDISTHITTKPTSPQPVTITDKPTSPQAVTSTAKPTPQPTTNATIAPSTTSATTSAPTSPSPSPTTPPTTITPITSSSTVPPKPTPTPTPSDVWTITNSTQNITCIIAKMNISLEIHRENKVNKMEASPETKKAKGQCGPNIQTLEIILSNDANSSSYLVFSFNETKQKYFVSSIAMNISLNSSHIVSSENVTFYETGKNTSYSCQSYQLNFKPDNITTVTLSMHNIQVEAFRVSNSTKFSSAYHCSNAEVPDIVPLIVGLALAGLVVVVVIGYFIGRRRSQARGYLSM